MKNKQEAKIALVVITGIIILFFGMQFLKGLDAFSSDYEYRITFSDITGLSPSCPILSNGYRVGTVRNIDYNFGSDNTITVDVDINKKMQIPEGTRAEIIGDMLGNVKVNLILPEQSGKILKPGGLIDGRINPGTLGSLKDMVPSIQNLLPKIEDIMVNLNKILSDPAMAGTLNNINRITAELTVTTQRLNSILALADKELPALTAKAGNVLDNTGHTMQTAETTLSNANNMIASLNGKVEQMDITATMDKVNTSLANLQRLTDQLNSDDSSLGLLLHDPSFYNHLTQTMQDADSLLVDLRQHPKRYVHFSIFGKKDK